MLVGYSIGNLLGSNSFEIIMCALAAVAMDFDVVFSRTSMKYHRGVSHSILFAMSLSLFLAAIAFLAGQDFLKAYFLSAISSHSHLLLDFSTTWLIPIFYPSKMKSSFELDTAVNPLLLFSSIFWLIVIALSGNVMLAPPLISIIVILLLTLYLLLRYLSKQVAYRRVKGAEGEIALLPTFSPFKWIVLRRWFSHYGFTQKNGYLELLPARYVEKNTRTFPYSPAEIGKIKIAPPLDSERDAILFSASIEQIAAFISKFRYTNAVAKLEDKIWRVTWSAEEAGIRLEVLLQAENGGAGGVKLIPEWRRS